MSGQRKHWFTVSYMQHVLKLTVNHDTVHTNYIDF